VVFPNDARKFVGTFIVLEWKQRIAGTKRKVPANGGGRVLSIDDMYLHLQPFALAEPSLQGETVTKLGLKIEEELIPLVDIDTIYPAPLDGIQIVE
jgi:hypothetical protein